MSITFKSARRNSSVRKSSGLRRNAVSRGRPPNAQKRRNARRRPRFRIPNSSFDLKINSRSWPLALLDVEEWLRVFACCGVFVCGTTRYGHSVKQVKPIPSFGLWQYA